MVLRILFQFFFQLFDSVFQLEPPLPQCLNLGTAFRLEGLPLLKLAIKLGVSPFEFAVRALKVGVLGLRAVELEFRSLVFRHGRLGRRLETGVLFV